MPAMPVRDSQATQAAAGFILRGFVQGFGVRPAVARLAVACGLSGHVRNRRGGVVIHVEGSGAGVERFAARLAAAMPPGAALENVDRLAAKSQGSTGFVIRSGDDDGVLTTPVPRDLVVCRECLREVGDARNRRHGYAFTSCTNCGPRYSLVQSMPWERAATSMSAFPFCPSCQAEFSDAADRRFHAQTNCCAECGPQMWLSDGRGRVLARGGAAVQRAARAGLPATSSWRCWVWADTSCCAMRPTRPPLRGCGRENSASRVRWRF